MKLKKVIFIPLIILCCCILQACPENFDDGTETDIIFQNKSNSKIYVFVTSPGHTSNIFDIKHSSHMLQPNGSFTMRYSQKLISASPLKLVVYKESTIEKYSDEQLQMLDISDSIYICTLDYLKSCNFIVVYDPKEK